jgi:hypothetical protein
MGLQGLPQGLVSQQQLMQLQRPPMLGLPGQQGGSPLPSSVSPIARAA